MTRLSTPLISAVLAASLTACGMRYWICDDVPPASLAKLPPLLSQTQLFTDLASNTLADGVLAYRPEFELWSDGAQKRRWLWLPPGTRINTSDMDAWSFPEGTKVWKEFVRDGVRVETRLLTKLGAQESDWVAASYAWRADQSDAVLTPLGSVNALGTAHDVPAADQCMGCHGGRSGRVLGIAALQLGLPAKAGEVSLAELDQRGLLTESPLQSFSIPGTDGQRAALGYLYANCSHCHNPTRPASDGARCYDPRKELDFSLSVHRLGSLAETGAYGTARADGWKPGHPEDSELLERMQKRGLGGMPPLASKRVDDEGVRIMSAWISAP